MTEYSFARASGMEWAWRRNPYQHLLLMYLPNLAKYVGGFNFDCFPCLLAGPTWFLA